MLFKNLNWVSFLARRIRSTTFLRMLCIWKILLRVKAVFWYNLEYRATHRNDFATAESDFCRFLENHAPGSSKFKFKIPFFQCFFQKFSTFQRRRIVGNGPKMLIERALDAPDIMASSAFWIRVVRHVQLENDAFIYVFPFSSSQFLYRGRKKKTNEKFFALISWVLVRWSSYL